METRSVGTTGSVADAKNAEQVSKNSADQKLSNKAGSKSVSPDYEVDLSGGGKDIQEARNRAAQIAKDTSAIRQEKIDAIKEQIKNGTYQVDSGKVADGILKEAVREELAKREAAGV